MYRNIGVGRFEEVTDTIGQMNRVILAMGANYGDMNGDGFPDCYVRTGLPDLRSLTPNRMLRNVAGTRFVDVTTAGASAMFRRDTQFLLLTLTTTGIRMCLK